MNRSDGQRFVTLYRRQGARPSPRKELKKAKWLSEEALQIAVKRQEVKSKEEKKKKRKDFEFECRDPKKSKER